MFMESYKFVKELGQGGFGRVWLMKDESSRKQFVLKQVNLHHASKRERQDALLEVKLLATLKHPNIVTYLDSFHDSRSNLFILMAYCERGDMYKYIKRRNGLYFKEKQIIHWLIQLLLALKYLHEKHILHRDLKTENLYLTRSKLIKIGDLGIAKILNGENSMACTIVGTPFYMSPEMISFQPYNHKSDIWGLGCCVYEIIALERAFPAENLNMLAEKIKQGVIVPMPSIYNQKLIDIVMSMLVYNPEDRPSALEIMRSPYIKACVVEYMEFTKNNLPLLKDKNTQNNNVNTSNHLHKSFRMCPKIHVNNAVSSPNINVKSCSSNVKVPDINGNGDGNDNSQQRPLIVISGASNVAVGKTDSISASCLKETKNHSVNCSKNLFEKKELIKCFAAEKYKGKHSIEFLIKLAQLMKQARNANNSLGETYIVSKLPRIKQPLQTLPNHHNTYSSSSCYDDSRKDRVISPSVKSDSEVINRVKDDFTFLDQIKTSTVSVNNENNQPVNIVLSEARKILHIVRGQSADSELSKCVTKDSNIDDRLLTEILDCEKFGVTNVAARQRRREKLRVIKKSSSASSESLPICVRLNRKENIATKS